MKGTNKLHFGIRKTYVETANGVKPREYLVNEETEEYTPDFGNLRYTPPSVLELGGQAAIENLPYQELEMLKEKLYAKCEFKGKEINVKIHVNAIDPILLRELEKEEEEEVEHDAEGFWQAGDELEIEDPEGEGEE